MTFQDSDSDLVGKLGASLTPPAPRTRHVHLPRGEQSSGFFDLDALYTMYPEQARPAPLPVMMPKRARSIPIIIEEEPVVVLRRAARPKPIGWFAILVTWLATTTLGGLAATQLPGHVHLRTHAVRVAPAPLAPATSVTSVPAAPATSGSVAIPPSAPSSSDNAISVDQLPVAGAALAHAHPLAAPHVRHVAPHPARLADPAPAPVKEAEAAPSPAPAPPPVARAAPVSTANMSLDELIRHEVAAEQKRVHPTAPAP